MANIQTNAITGLTLRLEWYVTERNIEHNYTKIHYTLKGHRTDGNTGSWRTVYKTKLKINGQELLNQNLNRRIYHGSEIKSGDLTLWHNNQGDKSFAVEMHAGIGIYNSSNPYNAHAYRNFQLQRIPRKVKVSYAPHRDQDEYMGLVISNPANQRYKIEVKDVDSLQVIKTLSNQYKNGWIDFNIDHEALLNMHPTDKKFKLRYSIYTYETQMFDYWDFDYNVTTSPKINSAITVKDSNNILNNGNDIIQSLSDLYIKINPNQLEATVGASISKVDFYVQDIYKSENYTGKHRYNFNSPLADGGEATVTFKITDSRGLTAIKRKTIQVIGYNEPVIKGVFERTNNFETTTSFDIGVDVIKLGSQNELQELKYRYKSINGNYGDFKTVGILTPTSMNNKLRYNIPKFYKDLDNGKAWRVEVRAKDNFKESINWFDIAKGEPLMFLSATEKSLKVNNKLVVLEDDPRLLSGSKVSATYRVSSGSTVQPGSAFTYRDIDYDEEVNPIQGDGLNHYRGGFKATRNMRLSVYAQCYVNFHKSINEEKWIMRINKRKRNGNHEVINASRTTLTSGWGQSISVFGQVELESGDRIYISLAVTGNNTPTLESYSILQVSEE